MGKHSCCYYPAKERGFIFIYVCVFSEWNITPVLVTFYFGEAENAVESLYFYEIFIKVASRQCCTCAN